MEVITGKIKSAQKVCIYGVEGIGKSTLAAQFPSALFIDTEGSTKHMDVARLPFPSSWTMLLQQVEHVKKNPDLCQTLIIDTADWAERLCIEFLCARDKKDGLEGWGYGKGYTYLAEEFGRLLNNLTELIELNINVVITAHAMMRKFEQPDELGAYDRWELKLQRKTAPMVKEWADMVLFANYKTLVVNVDGEGATKGRNKPQGGKRVMYTTHHPAWDAKNRHDLPDEIPLDYSAIAHCIPTFREEPPTQSQPTQKVKTKTKAETEETKYWHNPAHACVFTAKSSEMTSDIRSVEITKAEYDRLVTVCDNRRPEQEQEPSTPPSAPSEQQTQENKTAEEPPIPPGVPKALVDLMVANEVTVEEIQQVVADRGYYPVGTPFENYDKEFVQGVLVGAWDQVLQVIKENRVPF